MLSASFKLVNRSVSLDVNIRMGGQVLGVVGSSGCGKTTLLQALAGLTTPTSGSIMLDDTVLFDRSQGINLPPHRRRIGMAFQDHRLWPHLSVRGNLRYAQRRARSASSRFALDQVADWLGLGPLLNRRVANLSGGEARRVGLARAVLCQPRLLLLDEPLAGLDPDRSERTLAMLARLIHHAQLPTIIVSHHHAQVLRLTDQLAAVNHRGVVRHDDSNGSGGHYNSAELAINRLELRVMSHHPALGITRLGWRGPADASDRASGNRQLAEHPDRMNTVAAAYAPQLPVGRSVVGLLESQQVVLSLAPVETVSMQNRLRGRIEALHPIGPTIHCIVALETGCRCMATITRQAAEDFQLHPAMRIWCLFKATALTVAEDFSPDSLASTLQPRFAKAGRSVAAGNMNRADRPEFAPAGSTAPGKAHVD